MRSRVVWVVGLIACAGAAWGAPPTDVLGYAVFGIERASLGGKTRVQGDAGVLFETLELRRNARVGGAAAAPAVVLKRGANASTLFCATVNRDSATCQPLPNPLIDGPAIVLAAPGNIDVSAPRRSQAAAPLAGGAYGRLTVGAKATVTLAGGAYQFESIDLGKRGALLCLAACDVTVRTRTVLGKAARFGANAGVSSDDVILRIAAQGGSTALDAARNVTLLGSVYGPSGDVRIGADAVVTGAVVGNAVTIGRRGRLQRTAGGA